MDGLEISSCTEDHLRLRRLWLSAWWALLPPWWQLAESSNASMWILNMNRVWNHYCDPGHFLLTWIKNYISSKVWVKFSLSLGMDTFHPTLYDGCDYLSMLGFELNHISKEGSCLLWALSDLEISRLHYLWVTCYCCSFFHSTHRHSYMSVDPLLHTEGVQCISKYLFFIFIIYCKQQKWPNRAFFSRNLTNAR